MSEQILIKVSINDIDLIIDGLERGAIHYQNMVNQIVHPKELIEKLQKKSDDMWNVANYLKNIYMTEKK